MSYKQINIQNDSRRLHLFTFAIVQVITLTHFKSESYRDYFVYLK